MTYIDKINELIAEGKTYTFRNNSIAKEHGTYSKASVKMQAWVAECEDFIIINYGLESSPYRVFSKFERKKLDGNYQDTFDRQKDLIMSALEACLRIPPKQEKLIQKEERILNLTDIFIVHGHNEEIKIAVARTVEKLGLNPIILHEKANEGKTIIEKFETHSQVGFAIVILTDDDEGKSKDEIAFRKRARQNVVLELGYFIGKLKRNRILPLYSEGVELPSDIHGLLYTPLDKSGNWKFAVARELKAAGYDVDANKLL